MLKASSFDQDLYNQLKLISQIQKSVSNLNNESLEEIGNQILQNEQIIEKKENIYLLAQIVLNAADYRPKNIETLADLFIYIQQSNSYSNKVNLLEKYIVSFMHSRRPLSISSLFFLRTLFSRNAISLDSILSEINIILHNNHESNDITNQQFIDDTLDSDPENTEIILTRILNWFYPEIKSASKEIIKMAKDKYHYQVPKEYQNDDDEETLKKMMETGYSLDILAEIIRNDDIDSFKRYIEQKEGAFHIHHEIKSSIFERCSILLNDPTLLQYSAFFGSIKIFDHLLSLLSNIDPNENDFIMLPHFAIAGGSFDIIHTLEEKGFEFFSGIPTSIKYFQNDILSWILDNHNNFRNDSSKDSPKLPIRLFDYSDPISFYNEFDENRYYECLLNNYRNEYIFNNCSQYSEDEYDIDEDDKKDLNQESDSFSYFVQNKPDNLKFIDIDATFNAIMDSNNYLALFTLFSHGLDINTANEKSQETILHYAIKKGKLYLVKLLLSVESIDLSIADINEETPLMYSIIYNRKKIFSYMMNDSKILDSLTDQNYIKMIFYSKVIQPAIGIYNLLIEKWKVDLISLIDSQDIQCLCNVFTYLPFNLYERQFENAIIHTFDRRDFNIMHLLFSRLLLEKDLYLTGNIEFVNAEDEAYEALEFGNVSQYIESYLKRRKHDKIVNYYTLFNTYIKQTVKPPLYVQDFKDIFGNDFSLSFNTNCIALIFVTKEGENKHIEINFNMSHKKPKPTKKRQQPRKKDINKKRVIID